MFLIVGLGNPGPEHAAQRHNVGFMAVDVIHARHGFQPWRRRFQGQTAEGTLAGVKTLLLKPQTYMNLSGTSVGEAAKFYKIDPADILVIHDEVDLAPGKMRMKTGGGSAGHNGLKSISGHLGDNYRRLRIGIGHPGVKEMVPVHVLHDFAKADRDWLIPLLDAIGDNAGLLAEGKDSAFASRVHDQVAPPKPKGEKAGPANILPPKVESPSQPPAGDKPAESAFARGLKRWLGKTR
jgi:PTH1 family peptidyl-tRNA hydrolase